METSAYTAEDYRKEADRVRLLADMVFSAETRQLLLEIAHQYEMLATMAERKG